jgi:HEAT repeat protein
MMRTGLVCSLVLWLPLGHAQEELIDSPMYHSPRLPAARQVPAYVDAKDLWLKALARPNAELRRQAADTIALAHQRGIKGLDKAIAPLRAVLDQPDQHPTVLLAAARALIALDARAAAPSLLRHARQGGDLGGIIEPVLARWDYQPARAVWLERLRDREASPRALVRAIQGLAAVKEEKAVPLLREMVLAARLPRPVRLEAAAALGRLRGEGLEEDAGNLAAGASARDLVGRLAAVALLGRHRGDKAARVLQRLADDPEPAVAAPAVARLLTIAPELVLPALERLLASPDAKLRSLGVEAVLRQPAEKRIHLLRDRLGDVHPDVRGKTRDVLEELAKKGFRKLVIEEATAVLAGERWQGLEQATVLLARLDHKPAAERLLELLRFERPEVFITAAWGLRKLAVPETLEKILSYVRAKQRQLRAGAARRDPSFILFDHQLSQLNQLFGQQKYGPAGAVLEEFIPRMERPMMAPVCQESRAAAIWALGLLHKDKPVPALATAFEARLNDNSQPPEDARVRRMAAIALGQMLAETALASLRKYCPDYKPTLDPINNACGWALERLTRKPLPAPETIRVPRRDWFLFPFE